MKKLLCTVFAYLMIIPALAAPVSMVWEDVEPASGSGSADDPYCYEIDADSKVTWKHLLNNKELLLSEEYICYDGSEISYKWFFPAENIRNAEGPYFLGVRFYDLPDTEGLPDAERSLYFSTANKRSYPGIVFLTINVSDCFAEDTVLTLCNYGGYDPAVVHGPAPVVQPNEIRNISAETAVLSNDIIVKNGFVTLRISSGGNFVLSENTPDFSALGASVSQHDPTETLGSAQTLFTSQRLAQAVADTIGVDITYELTQEDIDLVQSLYLADLGLGDIAELARINWSGLQSLTLSKNDLTEIPPLQMPKLTYLDVSNNKLLSISTISRLPLLRSLVASGNSISTISDLSDFKALQSIDLSDNRLTVIPTLRSPSLRYINFEGNPTEKVPDDFSEITSLETIIMPQTQKANRGAWLGIGMILLVVLGCAIVYLSKAIGRESCNEVFPGK